MKQVWIAAVLGAGVWVLGGCAPAQPQKTADVRKTDPDWYTKPENSRVPFKVTDSYSFIDPVSRGSLVDDIDARDDAVQQVEEKK